MPGPFSIAFLLATLFWVPKNQKIIDYIGNQFNITAKQDGDHMSDQVYTNLSHIEQLFGLYSIDYIENLPPPLHGPPSFVPPISQTSLEGSTTSSCLSELQSLERGSDHALGTVKQKRNSLEDLPKSNGFESKCIKAMKRAKNGPYKSKNLLTERNRRKRIKDGIFALRSLVPNISKMNRMATLGDAANYIEELLETIDHYNDEIQAMEVDHQGKINVGEIDKNVPVYNCFEDQSGANEKKPIKAHIEVNQLGTKDFLLKIVCRQNRGGFSRLIDAMDSLGLKVIDVNVTSFNGSVSNILKVEANREGIEIKTLKNSLIQIVS